MSSSLVLGVAGSIAGAAFLPAGITFAGVTLSGATIGGFVGSGIGTVVDSFLFGDDGATHQVGPQIAELKVQSATPGDAITLPFGRTGVRIPAEVIWLGDLRKVTNVSESGGKGGSPSSSSTTFTYFTDVALAVGEGPVGGFKRIWAGAKLIRRADGTFTDASDMRVYLGDATQLPDATIQAREGVDQTPAFRGTAYVVIENLALADFGNRLPNFSIEVYRDADETAGSVVRYLATRNGLDLAHVDTDSLAWFKADPPIEGFAVNKQQSARQIIQALAPIFGFDGVDTGDKLVFRHRDRPPDVKIFSDDFASHTPPVGEPPDKMRTLRLQRIKVPHKVTLQYLDPERDLQENMARAFFRRPNPAVQPTAISLPLVLSASLAKQRTEALLEEAQTEAEKYQAITLPTKYGILEPGDLAEWQLDGRDYLGRITELTTGVDGTQIGDWARWRRKSYTSNAVAQASDFDPVDLIEPEDSLLVLMDLPAFLDTQNSYGFTWAVTGAGDGSGWRNATLYRATDDVNFSPIASHGTPAIMGTADTVLPDANPATWDRVNEVVVTLFESAGGGLQSVSETQALNWANVSVLGGEIFTFRDAELIGPRQYRLSNLLRGERGTEFATASHVVGERFVLLHPAWVQQFNGNIAWIEQNHFYRAVSGGQQVDDASSQNFVNTGAGLKPWSPVYLAATRANDDIVATWTRRNRILNAWTDSLDDLPMTEAQLLFDFVVLDAPGGNEVRVIETPVETATYTAAEQIQDFGSVQGPGTVNVVVYQISDVVHRGFGAVGLL